jgi:transcriptional regulator with XRE-family HTH domain
MDNKAVTLFFVANVRRLIEAKGWTQNEFAERFGIESGAASRLLGGRNDPSVKTLAKLGEFFGVEPHELLLPVRKGKVKK